MSGRVRAGQLLGVLTLAVAVVTVVFALLPGAFRAPRSGLVWLTVPGSFSIVGYLIATRRPHNSIGWLSQTIGLLFIALGLQETLARWLAGHGHTQAAGWAGAFAALWAPALGLFGTHLLMRLPDGRLLSLRWRRYAHFCTGVIVLVFVLASLDSQGGNRAITGVDNPIGVEGASTLWPLFLLFPVSFLGAIASVFIRYRRAHGLRRLQLRWIALGAAVYLTVSMPSWLVTVGVLATGASTAVALDTIAFISITAVPISIGVAVMRYRLYELDRLVNRALIYGVLTALLAATYVGGVLLLGVLLRPLTESSDLEVAGSTLAVAALFRPARNRVRSVVDRHFYRRRYDAQRMLESFSLRVRDHVDLGELDHELRTLVSESLQPATVSLWLREAAR